MREIPEDIIVKKGGYSQAGEYTASSYAQTGPVRPGNKLSGLSSMSVSANQSPKLDLNKGDIIQHTAFGRGMVLSVIKMGSDALLEIAFDNIGTKKLMANTASPHIKRLS